jgi:cyclic pyranopterin phosphate synthase
MPLIDRFGRRHESLRISVTDRCNIRCTYCMPETVTFLPRREILTFEEIERFARILVRLGIVKIRLTGGEPLVRRDLPDLVARLARIQGLTDLGLTTNGLLLAPLARPLREAGLQRLNVSLDTLDPIQFEQLARRPGLDRVLEGIDSALTAGIARIKLNAVAIRGVTESAILPLAHYARERNLELRFIESMPLDGDHAWQQAQVLTAREILETLESEFGPLRLAPDQDPHAPSLDLDYTDGGGRVGVIASVTRPFCGACNRLRITADGRLRNCLFALEETDIRSLLRSEAGDDEVVRAVEVCVAAKWAGHGIGDANFHQPERAMYAIGG